MALTDNLYAYYKFDGDADDATSNGRNATATNVTNGSSYGKINQGYYFNGSSSSQPVVTTPFTDTNFCGSSGSAFSFSCWAKFDEATFGENSLVSSYDGNPDGQYFALLGVNSGTGNNNRVRLVIDGSSASVLTSTVNLSNNTWYHIVATFDGTNSMKVYVNTTVTSLTSTPGDFTNGGTVRIGRRSRTTNDNAIMKGSIDEVGFWTRELSASEVSELYNSGDGLQYPFTAGWTGKINGVTNPSKLNGLAVANISTINGVE